MSEFFKHLLKLFKNPPEGCKFHYGKDVPFKIYIPTGVVFLSICTEKNYIRFCLYAGRCLIELQSGVMFETYHPIMSKQEWDTIHSLISEKWLQDQNEFVEKCVQEVKSLF